MRLVVGISGASGAVYGVRTLQVLKRLHVETHLVLTASARETIRLETDYPVDKVEKIATVCHDIDDMAASISSGSFVTGGMVVIPCSMKTLSGIATGYSDNLLLRSADVHLKERRPLVLVARETPLSLIHLQNMVAATKAGALVLPAMPAFYHRPETIEDIIDQVVAKALDAVGVKHNLVRPWKTKRGRSVSAD